MFSALKTQKLFKTSLLKVWKSPSGMKPPTRMSPKLPCGRHCLRRMQPAQIFLGTVQLL